METVTFRATSRQMRNLALFTLGSAAFAATLLGIAFGTGFDPDGRVISYGLACAVSFLLGVVMLVLYRRAFTTCTAEGLSSRRLTGSQRSWPWHQIEDIRIRQSATTRSAPTFTVTVFTTSGSHFTLGAPVSGGIMPDAEIEAKVRRIRSYWHTAVGGGPGTDAGSPVPVYVGPPPRLRGRTVARGCVVLLLVAAIAMLPFAISSGGQALAIRLGAGQAGTFTAVSESCSGPCFWVGDFRASGGSAPVAGLALAPGGGVTAAGRRIPAAYPGHGSLVYPAGGGTTWVALALVILTIAIAGSIVAYWTVRRRWRAGAGQAGVNPGRELGQVGAGLVLAGVIVVIIFGFSFVAVTASGVPSARALPASVACAEYSAWVQAQSDHAGPPARDPALLAQAQQQAPGGPLGSDLNTLATDVSIAIAAGNTEAGLVDDLNATNAMGPVTRDCFG